ncbi:hypothetical protein [Roseibium salinum]|uniref:YARHG domain-containing protein n=1 Tax=Roseibium salinum TaxID=1604349 RepID=A0ABT3R583_9HYPH|nr:hypothetical protein [Roseibium sp. DSM 29163]MCX2724208.1 hypothetical protein [Roseibium sp. DSM 29163]
MNRFLWNCAHRKPAFAAAAATVLILAAVLPATAQSRRPDTRTMTCGEVQSLINQRGAVVMSTGQHTFDRYVANRNFCQHGEVLERDYVPARDNDRCYVQRCAIDLQFERF